MSGETEKQSLKISCTNIREVNKSRILGFKMAHIFNHLDTDVKIIVDSHTSEQTICNLRKDYKIKMAKYNIKGHYYKERWDSHTDQEILWVWNLQVRNT
jgi:UDP-N-acetylglucosamine transferase subunit ALG13